MHTEEAAIQFELKMKLEEIFVLASSSFELSTLCIVYLLSPFNEINCFTHPLTRRADPGERERRNWEEKEKLEAGVSRPFPILESNRN